MRRRNGFRQWRLVWFVFVGAIMVLNVIQVMIQVQISPQTWGDAAVLSMNSVILEEWIRDFKNTTSTSTSERWSGGNTTTLSNDAQAQQVDTTTNKKMSQKARTSQSIMEVNHEDLSTIPPEHQLEENEILDYHNSFSACLMIMDENHRLPEWLAYHYYMLPLRHVVLLVDPRSETSPMNIVHRRRSYIQIDVWNFTDLHQYKPHSKKHANLDPWERHRRVQKFFYTQCAHYFRSRDRTWTTFHDVDEYIYLNPLSVPHATRHVTIPGNIRRYLEEQPNVPTTATATTASLSTTSGVANKRKRGRHQQGRATAAAATTTTTTALQTQETMYQAMYKDHCIVMERNYYGSVSESVDRIQQGVPSFLNASHFETLSWLHRTTHSDMFLNGMGKSIVDVSGPPSPLTFTGSIHRIIPSCAPQAFPVGFGPLRVRHYLGSWQAYASRNDARVGVKRNRERYLFMALVGEQDLPDDSVRPWLKGFCRQFHWNTTLIQSLLQGSGQVPPISQQVRQAQWSMTPQQIANVIQQAKQPQQEQDRPEDTRFATWLEQRFIVQTLPNGTVQVQLRHSSSPPRHAVNGSHASASAPSSR